MTENKSWFQEKNRIRKIFIVYFFIFFVAVAFGGGYVYGKFGSNDNVDLINYYEDQVVFPTDKLPQVFEDDLLKLVWRNLQQGFLYRDDIDQKKMYYGAIAGFVSGAGDQFTTFFDPEQTKQFNEVIDGGFEGIGAEIGMKNDWITVVAPIAGSPAEKAGLLAGDIIYAIDKIDTAGLTVDAAVKMIRGPENTTVTLSILRNEEETKDITITRGKIEFKSVTWEFRKDGLAYVHVSGFHEDTDTLFDQFLEELKSHKIKGLIVDLRNNPGGLLTSANYLSGKWLDAGKVVVIEKYGDGSQESFYSENHPVLKDIPTVVLIDGGSASGSEILAGALKDHQAATLVGKKTYGKGSVQEMRPLPDGSSLKMTIAEWLTPNGTSINKEGIAPDVEVDYTAEDFKADKDPQLDKAVEILLKK
jgi:carboxyl-terminal processing protease